MHNIAVASDNVNIVITGELEIYRSTDGASTFSLSNQRGDATQTDYAHDDIHELAYNPLDHSLYVGSDGGVYKSTDDGVTYVAKYTGMSNTQYYHFDVERWLTTSDGITERNKIRMTGRNHDWTHLKNQDISFLFVIIFGYFE